ncbi:hypothetical protein JQ633_31995 [Bradyrhizobium tropiciagri]|uniref:hypothetical protein n=1 Tax=Bradyrhizobium tropiciagri TaxID=312253 RepID=UPI001BAA3C59|nr:hypothetical protein [Bradyrhizobium tropiciagri]MBR0875019.1 hypothetical protein [Bradyrhizobium tropiciagri]
MTPKQVADAWNSVTDEWWARRNKANADHEQWEVVHHWGGNLISEDTMKIVAKFGSRTEADQKRSELEDEARGAAVIQAWRHP